MHTETNRQKEQEEDDEEEEEGKVGKWCLNGGSFHLPRPLYSLPIPLFHYTKMANGKWKMENEKGERKKENWGDSLHSPNPNPNLNSASTSTWTAIWKLFSFLFIRFAFAWVFFSSLQDFIPPHANTHTHINLVLVLVLFNV
jgi:hypothetical protein